MADHLQFMLQTIHHRFRQLPPIAAPGAPVSRPSQCRIRTSLLAVLGWPGRHDQAEGGTGKFQVFRQRMRRRNRLGTGGEALLVNFRGCQPGFGRGDLLRGKAKQRYAHLVKRMMGRAYFENNSDFADVAEEPLAAE